MWMPTTWVMNLGGSGVKNLPYNFRVSRFHRAGRWILENSGNPCLWEELKLVEQANHSKPQTSRGQASPSWKSLHRSKPVIQVVVIYKVIRAKILLNLQWHRLHRDRLCPSERYPKNHQHELKSWLFVLSLVLRLVSCFSMVAFLIRCLLTALYHWSPCEASNLNKKTSETVECH